MYKAKKDFNCAVLGGFTKDQEVEESERAEQLHRLGYLEKLTVETKVVEEEVETKVVKRKPAKRKPVQRKTKSKK